MVRTIIASLMLLMLGSFANPIDAEIRSAPSSDIPVLLLKEMIPLRSGKDREWDDFSKEAPPSRHVISFSIENPEDAHTLWYRQVDVKQRWKVLLNGKLLKELLQDESDHRLAIAIPNGLLRKGANEIEIIGPTDQSASDDIRIGSMILMPLDRTTWLQQCRLRLTVHDSDTHQNIPCCVTIVDREGALVDLGTTSSETLAVRPGTLYSAHGELDIRLPAGHYRITAGRGFEYGIQQLAIELAEGTEHTRTMSIAREVDTAGWIACDPHVHTRTHSGHGDCTIEERMLTIAGEGIELPIATDHNKHIDYDTIARTLNVRRYFTPVVGNEVTTSIGHFNAFPIDPNQIPVVTTSEHWGELLPRILNVPSAKITILNHARDIHSQFRPFDPKRHLASIGQNLEDWPILFQAMEVINSGATQTEPFQLLHDWAGLINGGYPIVPIGSSDSHDVARYRIGQGRTYIQCDDRDVSAIDIDQAMKSFLSGNVLVSYGLLVNATLIDSANDPSIPPKSIAIDAVVRGPSWTRVDQLHLWQNGVPIRMESIENSHENERGVLHRHRWILKRPTQDCNFIVLASGPSQTEAYWRMAKPYQPTSEHWEGKSLASTSPLWFDSDRDGDLQSARSYAKGIYEKYSEQPRVLFESLQAYDEAVAGQLAFLLFKVSWFEKHADWKRNADGLDTASKEAFFTVLEALRRNGMTIER